MKIDHIAIWVNDLEEMKYFYMKYFGCTVNNKYENTGKRFSSYFLSFSEGARVELMKRHDIVVRDNSNNLGLAHLAFQVESRSVVDSMTEKFEKDGFKVEGFPRITGDGYYESVILDPENNRIELVANICIDKE